MKKNLKIMKKTKILNLETENLDIDENLLSLLEEGWKISKLKTYGYRYLRVIVILTKKF